MAMNHEFGVKFFWPTLYIRNSLSYDPLSHDSRTEWHSIKFIKSVVLPLIMSCLTLKKKQLCYRESTDRATCYVSRNLANCCTTRTGCTTNPQQIAVMDLVHYNRPTCNKICAFSHARRVHRCMCGQRTQQSTSFVDNTIDWTKILATTEFGQYLYFWRYSIQTAGLAFAGTVLCSYRVRGVDGSCAKHLTVESYTVIYVANSHTYYY